MTALPLEPEAALAAVMLVALCAACGDSGGVQCECADPAVTIELPADRAAALSQVQLSGAACRDVQPTCAVPAAGGCSQLVFRATAAGKCVVDLQFSSGYANFEATIQLGRLACCPGYYATPPGSAKVQVPAEAQDGGTDG